MKSRQKRKPLSPTELNAPFPMQELIELRGEMEMDDLFSRGSPFRFEVKRRLLILAELLQVSWPQNEDEWLTFLFELCVHFRIPGFRFKEKGGAPVRWNSKRALQLVDDVTSLMKPSKMSARAACLYIAAHPGRFNNRYKQDHKTLYDRYRSARQKLSNTN